MATENEQIPASGDAPDADRAMEEYNASIDEFLGKETAPADAAAQEPAEETDEGAVADPAPADAAAVEDVPADGQASPANETPIDDIWSNAPPELKAAYEKANRDAELRIRSANGRAISAQRQLEALSRQQQGGVQQGQEPAQPKDSGPSPVDAAIAKLTEDYPELAGPLRQLAEAQSAQVMSQAEQIATLTQAVQTFEQTRAEQYVLGQQQILVAEHPDFEQVIQDERFEGWFEQQSPAVKAARARNAQHIVDGRDAALVIGLFKRDMGIGAAVPAPAPTPTPPPTPAPAMTDKRQRQLDAGRDAGRSGAPIRTGLPPKDDHDAAFEHFMAQAQRQG